MARIAFSHFKVVIFGGVSVILMWLFLKAIQSFSADFARGFSVISVAFSGGYSIMQCDLFWRLFYHFNVVFSRSFSVILLWPFQEVNVDRLIDLDIFYNTLPLAQGALQ